MKISVIIDKEYNTYCNKMKELIKEDGDPEYEHVEADDILCELLKDLGLNEIVELYEKVNKWYS